MTNEVTMQRSDRTRPPLTRARVLAEAVALADADGLAPLSMRTLAAGLDVVPMALYKHVTNKDALIDGMIDTVIAGYQPADPGLRGVAAVRARIDAARAAVRAHPWIRDAIDTRERPTPGALAHLDAISGELRDAGYSVDLVHYAMHALGHRVWGYSPEAFDARAGSAPAPAPDEATARALAERYPNVVAIAADAHRRNPSGACEPDTEFVFTLELLLDAIERLHASGWESRPLSRQPTPAP